MAVSSTGATLYICRQKCPPAPTSKNCTCLFFPTSASFALKHRRFLIKSSSDVSSESTAPTEVEDSESSIEAPIGHPSLISALNVERALRGIPITDADHYGRLGVNSRSSYDQVTFAYNQKVKELLNEGLDEEDVRREMELLKESYSILSSEEERRMYDWSLARSEKPDKYMWPYEVDPAKISPEDPPPQEPEDVGPTRAVGYFILGWLLLSFVFSIAFNRS